MPKGAEAFICIQPIAMITPCANREKQLLSPFLNIVRTFRKLLCQQYDILLQIRTRKKTWRARCFCSTTIQLQCINDNLSTGSSSEKAVQPIHIILSRSFLVGSGFGAKCNYLNISFHLNVQLKGFARRIFSTLTYQFQGN